MDVCELDLLESKRNKIHLLSILISESHRDVSLHYYSDSMGFETMKHTIVAHSMPSSLSTSVRSHFPETWLWDLYVLP